MKIDYLKQPIAIRWDASNASKKDIARILEVVSKLKWVVNSSSLRVDILGKLNGFKQTNHDTLWHLKRFVEGDERGKGDIDFEFDLIINFYFKRNKVIAYTNFGSEILNFNKKFWNRNIYAVCNTACHEYSHLVGGHHSYRRSKDWPETFPYWLGARVEYLLRQKDGMLEDELIYKPRTNLWERVKGWFRRLF
jgi:hypothetical protein